MDEVLKKANQSLLEGDRDEVLRLLNNRHDSTMANWLLAHAVKEDEQRLSLLRQVSISSDSVYGSLAKAILDRERQYESELAKPADYKFWTRQPWQSRLKFLKKNKNCSIYGAIALIICIIGAVAASIIGNQQGTNANIALTKTAAVPMAAQDTPRLTPSVTALPSSSRSSVSYAAGRISLVRIEFPTNRPVTFSNISSERAVATPAIGAQFAAFQLEFMCLQAICDGPPQAELALQLSDQSIVRYSSGSRPLLLESAGVDRASKNQSVLVWFVFEVPINLRPATLKVVTGESNPVLELNLPN
jgi:hypothetical protein